MTPEEILLKADDHLLTASRGFSHKISGVLRNEKLVLAFVPNQVNKVVLETGGKKKTLELTRKKTDLTIDRVFNGDSFLQFHPSAIGSIFNIDIWSQNRKLNWNWFLKLESVLSNYTSRLKYSILSGINIYKQSGLHDLIFTPGMLQFGDVLYVTPEIIQDMRPDINMIPPRGSMLKVFFVHEGTLNRVDSDNVIYDFDSITIFLGEGQKKEVFDEVIAEEIYQRTDVSKNNLKYVEIARVWVKDCLHRPPILEVIYDTRVRRPNFLNWSI